MFESCYELFVLAAAAKKIEIFFCPRSKRRRSIVSTVSIVVVQVLTADSFANFFEIII